MSNATYRTIDKCRVCGSHHLTGILSLGDLYVSDFPDSPDVTKGINAPLELVLCNVKDGGCGLLQLKHTVSSEAMYRNYWYRSGIFGLRCIVSNLSSKKFHTCCVRCSIFYLRDLNFLLTSVICKWFFPLHTTLNLNLNTVLFYRLRSLTCSC